MNTPAYLTFTLSAATLAKLNELRRLQIERWRAAYFKREGEMPADGSPELDRTWVAVTIVPHRTDKLSLALRISLLAAWTATFKGVDNPAFEVKLIPGGVLMLRRGSSTLRTYGAELEHTPEGLPYIPSFYPNSYDHPPLVFPDPAVPLTIGPDGAATLPPTLEGATAEDATAELKALRAEATATRKALAHAKAVTKARKAEAAALKRLEEAQTEADEAQALIDGQSMADALKYARRVLNARRLWHKTQANPELAPAWLPLTYTEPAGQVWSEVSNDWEETPAREVPAMPEYRDLLTAYRAAVSRLAEYKPRMRWPSWYTAKDKLKNPEAAIAVYGPKHEELTEQLTKARRALLGYLEQRFAEFAGATLGLTFPAAEGCSTSNPLTSQWIDHSLRPYSRARLLLKAWHASVKHELEGAYDVAKAARVRLEGGSED